MWHYVPQCVDYLRLLLCVLANCTMVTDRYVMTAVLLFTSGFLDHFDGRAARYFNQCTVLGDAIDWSIDLYTDMLFHVWWGLLEPAVVPYTWWPCKRFRFQVRSSTLPSIRRLSATQPAGSSPDFCTFWSGAFQGVATTGRET